MKIRIRKRTIIALCLISVSVTGLLSSQEKNNNKSAASKKAPKADRGVKARVLIDNMADAPLPWLTGAFGPPRSTHLAPPSPIWKPNKTGSAYDFTMPYEYVKMSVTPMPIFPKGRPKGIAYHYKSFIPKRATFARKVNKGRVTLGVLRIIKPGQIKVDLNRKGFFVAEWKGSSKAAFYTVCLYPDVPDKENDLTYTVFTCDRTRPEISVKRTVLLELLKSHSQIGKVGFFPNRMKWSSSGKLVEVHCNLKMIVTGIDASGQPVYEACSGKINFRINDRDELKIIKELGKGKKGR